MNFRECKLVSIHRLLREIDSEIPITKTFLLQGGLKIALYRFKFGKNELVGLCGSGETNTPFIFEEFQIDYNTIDAREFLEEFNESHTKFLYIIPVLSDFLSKEIFDMKNIGVVGQSYLVVESMDSQKIYFDFQGEQSFLKKDILLNLSSNNKWLVGSDFEIYKIDRLKLKTNEFLKSFISTSEVDLLKRDISQFGEYQMDSTDDGLVRIEGFQVYDLIIEYFQKMKDALNVYEGTDKYNLFKKFICIQMIHMQKLVCGGTDTFFRGEFLEILRKLKVGGDKHSTIIEKWGSISADWRNLARKLQNTITYERVFSNPEESISHILNIVPEIRDKEIGAVKELQSLLF